MHLFTGTALFDGSARQCLDECQIALIGDEHRVGTVVETPLAQFAHRHVRDVDLLGGLDQFRLFDTGQAQHLPDARLAVRLVDGLVFGDVGLLVLGGGGTDIRVDGGIIHAFVDENLGGGHQLATGTTGTVGVLHVQQRIGVDRALDDGEASGLQLIAGQAQPRGLSRADMAAQTLIQGFGLPTLLVRQ